MQTSFLLSLVQSSLWGTHGEMRGQTLAHDSFGQLTQLATQQAVMGLVSQGLMDSGIRLEWREDALNLFALQQSIRQRNRVMDEAVVRLCQEWAKAGVRILVIKGQTLAALYPHARLRQSGDIDFLCHPDDWERAMAYARNVLGVNVQDSNSEKHVEWQTDGVQYEMHRWLASFAYPRHHRYWEEVVVPELWAHPYTVRINDYDVPTLAPTYNVLYTFVHIFCHLILDGIGLRQFCDEAVLLQFVSKDSGIQLDVLARHLDGIGLRRAFVGVGAVLTDYLGLPEEAFPLDIPAEAHRQSKALMRNVLEMGNFGSNVAYKNRPGVMHGLEHLMRIARQAHRFHHYAPLETWGWIPYMFRWWWIKVLRQVRR